MYGNVRRQTLQSSCATFRGDDPSMGRSLASIRGLICRSSELSIRVGWPAGTSAVRPINCPTGATPMARADVFTFGRFTDRRLGNHSPGAGDKVFLVVHVDHIGGSY